MMEPIAPMLATASPPFDSQDHLFEIKWDGVRCLTAVDHNRVRLWGRELADYTDRYPEMDVLRKLPQGTLVDGELVVLRKGRAELGAILRRHQLTSRFKTKLASRHTPVLYVVFDVLVHAGTPVMGKPFGDRREILADLLRPLDPCRVALSDGVVGAGTVMYEEVVEQGHEGIMAKHLRGRYVPGRRSSCWRKIKPTRVRRTSIIPGRRQAALRMGQALPPTVSYSRPHFMSPRPVIVDCCHDVLIKATAIRNNVEESLSERLAVSTRCVVGETLQG